MHSGTGADPFAKVKGPISDMIKGHENEAVVDATEKAEKTAEIDNTFH